MRILLGYIITDFVVDPVIQAVVTFFQVIFMSILFLILRLHFDLDTPNLLNRVDIIIATLLILSGVFLKMKMFKFEANQGMKNFLQIKTLQIEIQSLLETIEIGVMKVKEDSHNGTRAVTFCNRKVLKIFGNQSN